MKRAAVVLLAVAGCGDRPASAPPPPASRCGAGPPALSLGVGDPFEARPDGVFRIDAGRQGGHHVDLSVRLTGTFDPDHVDVEVALWAGHRVGHLEERDWFLHLIDEVPACDYLRARLVLVDEEGGLFPPARFSELTQAPLRLEVRMTSAGEVAALTSMVTLLPP